MKVLQRLREKITKESHAYGYTLSVWASGAVLITRMDLSHWKILTFVFGAVIGFLILAIIAFNNLLEEADPEDNEMLVVSMVHLIAALGTVYVSHLLTLVLTGFPVFFMVGVNATFTFNMFLLVEDYFSEKLLLAESRIVGFFSKD